MAKLLYNSLAVPFMYQSGDRAIKDESSSIQYNKLGVVMTEARLVSFEDGAAEFEYISFDKVAAKNGWSTEEAGDYTLPTEISVENADLTGLVGKMLYVYFDVNYEKITRFIHASEIK